MTREKKIEAIYKEMANKKVSFGCRYEHNGSVYTVDSGNYRLMQHGDSYYLYIDAHCNCPIEIVKLYNDFSNQGVVKIIGHPVMIGDVLDWVSGRIFDATKGEEDFLIDDGVDDVVGYDYKLFSMRSKISSAVNIRWNYKRLPIEKQTDRCIDFIYSLIKK